MPEQVKPISDERLAELIDNCGWVCDSPPPEDRWTIRHKTAADLIALLRELHDRRETDPPIGVGDEAAAEAKTLKECLDWARGVEAEALYSLLMELQARRENDGMIYVEPGQLVGVPPSVGKCHQCGEAIYFEPSSDRPEWYCLTGCYGDVDANIPDDVYQWAKEKVRVREE